MSSPKSVTIQGIRPFGKGSTGEITFSLGNAVHVAKTFLTKTDGSPIWAVGEVVDVLLTKKPPYNSPPGTEATENWIEKPKPAGGGFKGGGAKADPAKIAVEQERNAIARETNERFDAKWSIDRRENAHKQADICACVIVKAAVDVEIANVTAGHGIADPNRIQSYVADLVSLHQQLHEEIYETLWKRDGQAQ